MPFNTKLIAKLDVQVAGNALPSSEGLYLGGASSVRGYPEGDFIADTGYLLNFDYLVPFFFLPEDWRLPWSDSSMKQDFELVGFLDQGYGTIRDASGSQNHDRNLVGIGGGLRVRLYDRVFGRAEFGYALGQVPTAEPENRFQVHLKVQAEV
jgi:hemolysin activation/secretion protein